MQIREIGVEFKNLIPQIHEFEDSRVQYNIWKTP